MLVIIVRYLLNDPFCLVSAIFQHGLMQVAIVYMQSRVLETHQFFDLIAKNVQRFSERYASSMHATIDVNEDPHLKVRILHLCR